jgi:hypothetical protein
LSSLKAASDSSLFKISALVIFSFFLTLASLFFFNTVLFIVTIVVSALLAVLAASIVAKSLNNDTLPSHSYRVRRDVRRDFSVDFGFPLSVLILLFTSLNLAAFASSFSANVIVASGLSGIFLVVFFLVILSRVSKLSDLFSNFIPQPPK